MTKKAPTRGLRMTWVPVRDADGHTRLEVRWTGAPVAPEVPKRTTPVTADAA